jgi:hypothetical protein
MRRALPSRAANQAGSASLNVDREQILSDFNSQRDLFYRVFPNQVDQGSKKPPTLDWMINRCADGTKKNGAARVYPPHNFLMVKGDQAPPPRRTAGT